MKKFFQDFKKFSSDDITFGVSQITSLNEGELKMIEEKIKSSNNKDFRVLNLFAYTGCATMAASKAGATEVVHVDASKGIVDVLFETLNNKCKELTSKHPKYTTKFAVTFGNHDNQGDYPRTAPDARERSRWRCR